MVVGEVEGHATVARPDGLDSLPHDLARRAQLVQHRRPVVLHARGEDLGLEIRGGERAALELLEHDPKRGSALLARAERWRDGLAAAGWPRPAGVGPILPLLVGESRRALALQHQLEQAGLLAVAIRPPTVPEGSARLRLVLRHNLPAGSLQRLLAALGTP